MVSCDGTTSYKGSSLSMNGHICYSDDGASRRIDSPIRVLKLKEEAVDLYKSWIGSRVNGTVSAFPSIVRRPPRRLTDVFNRPSRSAYRRDQNRPLSFDHWLENEHPQLINVIHIDTMEKIGI